MNTNLATETPMAPSPVYLDSYKNEFRFNDHVCIEMLMGVPDEKRTGRLVQVRKGVGAFGSDIYFLRLRDGNLMSFENALMRQVADHRFENAFYRSNGNNPPVIPEQPIEDQDTLETEYTIAGKWPESGFIVEQPKQPDSPTQSFRMAVLTK